MKANNTYEFTATVEGTSIKCVVRITAPSLKVAMAKSNWEIKQALSILSAGRRKTKKFVQALGNPKIVVVTNDDILVKTA